MGHPMGYLGASWAIMWAILEPIGPSYGLSWGLFLLGRAWLWHKFQEFSAGVPAYRESGLFVRGHRAICFVDCPRQHWQRLSDD